MKYKIGVKYTACLDNLFIDATNPIAALWKGYVKYKSTFDLYEMDIKKDFHSSIIIVWNPSDVTENVEGKLIDLYRKSQKILEEYKG